MNRYHRWNAILVAAGFIIVLTAACTALCAEDKKEIPNHAGFQSCKDCHGEMQAMWDSSGHSKAIRRIAVNNPSAADCGGCHSTKRLEAGQKNAEAPSAGEESFHKVGCLACHARQTSAYDHRVVVDPDKLCDTCHTQRSVLWGKGARGVEDSRNFHSGVPCISCHMTEGNHRMKVLRPDGPGLTEKRQDTCTLCHKDNNREARVQQIQEWQSTYDENMAPLLADVKSIDAALKQAPGLLDASLKSKFDNVKANLSILQGDGSRGFHNFVMSLEITGLASGDLKEIKAAIK
ncbi:MAG TPA: cytochrome c3 family protein [Acidobacteriota bacterium]|nr:cytochrome c3 family protein [Acidobacteriota bacterium]